MVVIDFGLWVWWLWVEEREKRERETRYCGGVDCFGVVGVVAMG